MYRKVLLCYDGTREGRRALRQGADVSLGDSPAGGLRVRVTWPAPARSSA